MKKGDYLGIFLVVIVGVFSVLSVVSGVIVDEEVLNQFSSGEEIVNVIVVLKDNSNIQKTSRSLSVTFSESNFVRADEIVNPEKIIHKFEGGNSFSVALTQEEIEQLKNSGQIDSIVYDYPVSASLKTSVPWINANKVWSIKVNQTNLTGEGQTVCIIDTGVDFTHPALVGKNLTCNIDCYNKSCSENCSVLDDHRHGTHVAGIVASQNSVYKGVAPGANLIGVKVLNSSGGGSSSGVMAGIDWCIDNSDEYNISVISMSLGGSNLYTNYCDNTTEGGFYRNAINNASLKNISVVISTGNTNFLDQHPYSISAPACVENAIRVGNVNNDGVMASSNRWRLDMLFAPGVRIFSANASSNGYINLSGTSMAAPHVSGAIAMLNQYSTLKNIPMSPSQINSILKSTGFQITNVWPDYDRIHYRIDVLAAISYLQNLYVNLAVHSPIDNYLYKNKTLLVNFSSNGEDSWFFNGTENVSYSLPSDYNFSEGANNLTFYSNSSDGFMSHKNVSFYVDTQYPNIVFQNISGILKRFENISFNISVEDNFLLKNVTLETNASGVMQNYSYELANASDSKTFSINLTAPKGVWDFSYKFYVEDLAGNINISDWHEVQIKNSLPILNNTYSSISFELNNNFSLNKSFLFYDLDEDDIFIENVSAENVTLSYNVTNGEINISSNNVTMGEIIFTINDTRESKNYTIPILVRNPSWINSVDSFNGETTNLSELTSFLNILFTLEDNTSGKINFKSINLTAPEINFSDLIKIEKNKISVNSSEMPLFNVSAQLFFYNITDKNNKSYNSTNHFVLYRDGAVCTSCRDSVFNNTTKDFVVNVSGFSVYEIRGHSCKDGIKNGAEEGVDCGGICNFCPKPSGGSASSGGGAGMVVCVENWSCSEWTECLNGTQSRICEDLGKCGTKKHAPPLINNCSEAVGSPDFDVGISSNSDIDKTDFKNIQKIIDKLTRKEVFLSIIIVLLTILIILVVKLRKIKRIKSLSLKKAYQLEHL